MSYLFKDTDRAARRLQVLADVFASSSRTFLQDSVSSVPELAVDLGCGPGYTTYLLAATTGSIHTIGLDSSEHFLALAEQKATDRIAFLRHDVTQVPFPTGLCNLISCRMLLTHLQNPVSVIEHWLTQLQLHGLLLMEEVEWIQTENSVFRAYLDIVAVLLEQQKNQLYIGPFLDKMQLTGNVKRNMSRVYRFPVSTKQAASMFSLNVAAWKDQPFIQQHYDLNRIEQLEQDLEELAISSTKEGEITWGMRQLAYERL